MLKSKILRRVCNEDEIITFVLSWAPIVGDDRASLGVSFEI